MERPHFTILAHPTGRLIGEREPYDVDMPRLIRAAKERGCFLELNAHPGSARPQRYSLPHGEGGRRADQHRHGLPIAPQELANLRFGVGQARRGWLEKSDVLNTRTLAELRPLLARTMDRAA